MINNWCNYSDDRDVNIRFLDSRFSVSINQVSLGRMFLSVSDVDIISGNIMQNSDGRLPRKQLQTKEKKSFVTHVLSEYVTTVDYIRLFNGPRRFHIIEKCIILCNLFSSSLLVQESI